MTAPPTIERPSPEEAPALPQSADAASMSDDDDPVRLAFVFFVLSFVAGCLLLPPMQWISSGIAFSIAGFQYFR